MSKDEESGSSATDGKSTEVTETTPPAKKMELHPAFFVSYDAVKLLS